VILDPPRPRRRGTRRLIVLLVIALAATVALSVSGTARDTRAELEYLRLIHSQASDIAVSAVSLSDTASRLATMDRVEFVTVTDGLRADIDVGLDLAKIGPPSDSLIAANSLYRQALEAWNRGVTGFGSGVLRAADDPSDPVAAENLADSLAEMRAGDQLYAEMVSVFDREDVPDPASPMPEVIVMPSDGGLISLSKIYVESARSPQNTLALRPGLGVAQLVADPEWVVGPDGQAVVPATDRVVFSVVVTNSGNVLSFPEILELHVTGGPEAESLTADLEPLEPGRSRTIVFDAVPVDVGMVYEVRAVLVVTHPDSSRDDNESVVVFSINDAPAGG
jgi:hypothetical protein